MKRKQLESHSGQRLERHARKNRNALSFVASGLPFENLPLNYPQSNEVQSQHELELAMRGAT
jgi:hypothetical protein